MPACICCYFCYVVSEFFFAEVHICFLLMDSVKDVEDFNFEFCVSMTLMPLVCEDLRKNFLPNMFCPSVGLFCQWISSQLVLAPIV